MKQLFPSWRFQQGGARRLVADWNEAREARQDGFLPWEEFSAPAPVPAPPTPEAPAPEPEPAPVPAPPREPTPEPDPGPVAVTPPRSPHHAAPPKQESPPIRPLVRRGRPRKK